MSLIQMLAQKAASRPEESVLPQNPNTEPSLAFMLAHQAIMRWRFDLERFTNSADLGIDREATAQEAEAAMQQIIALTERVEPFLLFVDMAVRFEAQENLASLAALRAEMGRIVRQLSPEAPWRDPAQVAEAMHARRH
jgi:hypothetical protein